MKSAKVVNVFDMAESLDKLSIHTFAEDDDFDLPGNSATESETFPDELLMIVNTLSGNEACVDCREQTELSWASVSFGVLMCEKCAFEHISTGLAESCTAVRSLSRNAWNLHEVISLLEGGNAQFLRCIGEDKNPANDRRQSTGARASILASRTTTTTGQNEEGPDFSKYKKKGAKSYLKKLSDRVNVVTRTFGKKNDGFNSRARTKAIEDPTFKIIEPITDYGNQESELPNYERSNAL